MGCCSRLGDRARLQAEACCLPHDRRGAEPSPRRSDDVRRAQRRSAFCGVEWFGHCAHRKTRREWTWYGRISSAGARRFRRKKHGRFGNPIGGVAILRPAKAPCLFALKPIPTRISLPAVSGGSETGSHQFLWREHADKVACANGGRVSLFVDKCPGGAGPESGSASGPRRGATWGPWSSNIAGRVG